MGPVHETAGAAFVVISVIAIPATLGDGTTVKLAEEPVIGPWVAVSLVVSALTSVIPAGVPTPEVKVTDAG
jgi:hypothetical protein